MLKRLNGGVVYKYDLVFTGKGYSFTPDRRIGSEVMVERTSGYLNCPTDALYEWKDDRWVDIDIIGSQEEAAEVASYFPQLKRTGNGTNYTY